MFLPFFAPKLPEQPMYKLTTVTYAPELAKQIANLQEKNKKLRAENKRLKQLTK